MKKSAVRVACAQINCTVGDLEGNAGKIIGFSGSARDLGVDIVLFPELALTGYPPEDLLLKPSFVSDNLSMIKGIASKVKGITAVVGFVDRDRRGLYNAAAVIADGRIKGVYHKSYLPNYGVFDEKRYFLPGEKAPVFSMGGCVFGVNICEDIWVDQGPLGKQMSRGAQLACIINASPYYAGKSSLREKIVAGQAKKLCVPVAYVNLVGGQDELVFDGQSLIVDRNGKVIARGAAFKEEIVCADVETTAGKKATTAVRVAVSLSAGTKEPLVPRDTRAPGREEEVYGALVLGLKDYVTKNGFSQVALGLSGGIDSSLVASLAVDALGKENVTGIFMPSRYSSRESEEDARALAGNLGIDFKVISIEPLYKVFLTVLEGHFAGRQRDITEENLQARLRGNILMAFSNKFGWLVLATGNKSEMSTGYATLYGDMAGGLAVIKDVPKILVYALCRWRNSVSPVIPERVMVKAPTAELKINQKDSDSLPEYDVLDRILKGYVEEDKHFSEVVAMGFDAVTVRKVFGLVDKSEYKRRQSPPGIKITPRAFGRDRRMPITNKYKEHGL